MKTWKWGVLALSLFLMFGNALLPPLWGLDRTGMATLGIFAGTMLLLILVNLIWPLLLTIIAFVVNGVYTLNDAIAMSLGHNVFWFVIFSCMIINVLRDTGILRRLAIGMISMPFTKKSPWLFIGALYLAILLMGCIMDCTALVILFSSLTGQILEEMNIKKGDKFAELLMLGVLIFVGVSYGATPIGHSVPLLAISTFASVGEEVNFGQYIGISIILALAIFALFMLALKFVFRLDVDKIRRFDPTTLKEGLGPMSAEEKFSIGTFCVIIVLWLLPSFIQNLFPAAYAFLNQFGIVTPLMLGCLLMCLIPIHGKPLMVFEETINGGVSWAAAFSMAVAMLLGSAVTNPEAGITDMLARQIGPLFGSMPPIVFVMIIGLLCMVLTNFSSSTVATMLSGTIAVALINSGAITGVNVAAMAVVVGNCACFAYAAPPGSTYAAYISGDGWVSSKAQFVFGGTCAIVFAVLFAVFGSLLGNILC